MTQNNKQDFAAGYSHADLKALCIRTITISWRICPTTAITRAC